ncbi:YpjP family protein [Bacillus songklensis]|uniref:YpjP family protein n=1 Tax=Bacillus songklensis TaxID=1069116 RepID=A0ABV8B5T9_9BACI
MPKWVRKTLIVLITVCTFGLVTPPDYLYIDDVKADKATKEGYVRPQDPQPIIVQSWEPEQESPFYDSDTFIDFAMEEAERQSIEKFGPKITPVIEDEFKEAILPQIEMVLSELASQWPEEEFQNLQISEKPAGGYGEKIFHVYNRETGKDLIRFHVRRDHPPQEGYWFNFHYHTWKDQFQKHHDLGSIYWDVNTPPKWLN